MTENEAIEIIQQQRENLHKVGNECQVPCENCKVNHCCFDYVAMGMAIQALEEIQPYRAIGTVEGYKRALEISKENFRVSMEYKAKVQEFEAIGTIEEFKALKEKNEAKEMDRYYCPICRHYFEDTDAYNYCPVCGQKMKPIWQ